MAVYMISYDLHAPTNNRDKVENAIKALGTWCKFVSTTFLVKSTLGVDGVQSAVVMHLDANDRMVICEVVKPIKGWLSPEQWSQANQNL